MFIMRNRTLSETRDYDKNVAPNVNPFVVIDELWNEDETEVIGWLILKRGEA